MRIRITGALITLLIATNLVLGYSVLNRGGRQTIKADHLQGVRINTKENGTIYVTLGASDTPSGLVAMNPKETAVLALTPRAAIQLQVELTRTIQMIQEAAKAERVASQSPGRSL